MTDRIAELRGRGGLVVRYVVAVPVALLCSWAFCVHENIGLDDVEEQMRALAACPTGDLADIVARIRNAGVGAGCCEGRHLCSYHEGWHDALNALADEL